MGRLTPAITSIFASGMTEIARLEGVPPNMSVTMMTPLPVLHAATVSRICSRRASISSSASIEMDRKYSCSPTTCSVARTSSRASLPWLTTTIPIIWPLLVRYEKSMLTDRTRRSSRIRDRRVSDGRKFNREACAALSAILRLHLAHMGCHDLLDDGQAQP